ncbi:MAG: hypothetical protein OEZ34_07245 [Spirochaetia bacterium]|nr:hypothetical protein [Spirochaetia bacterium]
MNFIKNHAQSLEESVIRSHIELYVNDFSLDTGSEGREAIQALKEAAEQTGLL